MRSSRRPKLPRTALASATLLALMAMSANTQAGNVTWTNASGSFAWNAIHANWGTGAWNNSGVGNEAVFGYDGIGNIAVDGAGVNVSSINFQADGYTVSGGPLNFVAGGGSLNSAYGTKVTYTAGIISTDPGNVATINSAINTSVGLIKAGAGTLVLAGPVSFTGGSGISYLNGPQGLRMTNDLVVDGYSGVTMGGTLQIAGSNVLPASTRVGLGNGQIDIGSNKVTIAALNFFNENDLYSYDPAVGASPTGSIIGSGTLRVTGDISVVGRCCGNNGANTIAANLDLGGGTQVIRVAQNASVANNRGLQITGVITNGSLLKTSGLTENGVPGGADGIGLYGNNTYTGSTVINGGTSLVTGTNASSFVEVIGANTYLSLQGANGSYGAATKVLVAAGGTLMLDNNSALAGNDAPTVPGANNANRLNDNAEVQLRNGTLSYTGASNTASSETFGKLNATGGHNVVSLVATGATGTSTLYASDLVVAPRATLQVTAANLGGSSKLFVAGALPASDSTGILHGVIGKADFVKYSAATGVTPLAAGDYAGSFAAGANVALTAASTLAASTSINALKTTGSFTTTIASGQVLNIASGMVLNSSGTATYTGGTIDFGSAPGTFFNGTNTINSAITGSNGLVNGASSLTLNGDLSGLAGVITTSGTTTLGTNTFKGGIELRAGTLQFSTSQTLAGQGAITVGVHENDSNVMGSIPTLSLSSLGANGVMNRDIVVDNGSQNMGGMEFSYSMLPNLGVLSNSSGSQTVGGNITLNSPLRVQGGGGSGTGSTNFTGNITGASYLYIPNGRASFTGNVGNTGGMTLGGGGFKTYVTFAGTTSGNGPLLVNGGSGTASGSINGTTISYRNGALPTGDIQLQGGGFGLNAPAFIPLENSTIANRIDAKQSDIYAQVGAGITANWNGQVTSDGYGWLVKTGAGTLVLNSMTNNVPVQVNAGTLLVNGQVTSLAGQGIAVNTGGTLGGTGNIATDVLVNAGGTINAGVGGVGTLSTGSLELAGAFAADIGGGADLINASNGLKIDATGTLQLALSGMASGTYLLLNNLGSSAISGTFSAISGLPAGYSWSVDYAFSGTDSLGRIGNGNDLALTLTAAVPEPSSYALLGAGLLFVAAVRRRRQGN
ncbi:autotransporter-associated beta strand repeat-containing protein [Pelomonas sp. KK5]|uniref:beta strand repeat-containing protein n=1 Tax=Pelomonas sp. KK5 TaxID=1855730 RepID=UPI00097CC00F|nr:autotransporter-associated beta strand repeat-containing protein [Pelomonas sp. KK5]